MPPHHTDKGFRNIHETESRLFGDFLRWRFGLGPEERPALTPTGRPGGAAPAVAHDRARIMAPPADRIQVTWIGHDTFLIQVDGLNILTDPIFSERASPLSCMGPKRLGPPGVPWEDLPPIHVVLISHNHYDHLDAATVKRLGNGVRYLVPLGLKRWFGDLGIDAVDELDWWQSMPVRGVAFHLTPAQHFTKRGLFDTNATLWGGWVIKAGPEGLFFAGDTGYSPHFREIGDRLGPFRLAFLPVGGYMPRWFMRSMHLDPPDAVRAHMDLRARQSIGMHWGTFRLTDEPLDEPPRYLETACQEAGLPAGAFTVLKVGETVVLE